MNKDEEVDADDLVSEPDRTRQKIRRDLEKFRRRLQGRVQLAAATGYKKNTDLSISLSSQIYRLYPRKQLDMSSDFFAGSLLVKILLAHSLSHAIQSR